MGSKIIVFLRFIKIEHTVFDLPFVFIGISYALLGIRVDSAIVLKILLIVIAAVLARISGMTLNRLIDYPLDKENPRTRGRELVTGKIKISQAKIILLVSSLLFILDAFYLNLLAGLLSPLVLLFFYLYPKTKKLPTISHFILGISIGIIVLAGYVGLRASFPYTWYLYGYSLFTALWIASFDIIYQNQDREFDKKKGMKSIPCLTNGKIFIPVASVNAVASAILIASSVGVYNLIANLIASFILLVSLLYVYKYDVDQLFKTFYLPVPFVIVFGIIFQLFIA